MNYFIEFDNLKNLIKSGNKFEKNYIFQKLIVIEVGLSRIVNDNSIAYSYLPRVKYAQNRTKLQDFSWVYLE